MDSCTAHYYTKVWAKLAVEARGPEWESTEQLPSIISHSKLVGLLYGPLLYEGVGQAGCRSPWTRVE